MKQSLLTNASGSVMLEFVLVLPVLLLLFGGTFLMFELTLARIHLQESNRNLAWLAEDRFDQGGAIAKRLNKEAKRYYEDRNRLEDLFTIGGEKLYGFGEEKNMANRIKAFSEGTGSAKVSLEVDKSNGSILSPLMMENRWCSLYSGNLDLKMNHISAVYLGAVGTADVIYPDESRQFYRAKYDLSRTRKSDSNPNAANGESLLIHRKSDSKVRASINTASWDLTWLTLEGWPIGEGYILTALGDYLDPLHR